jgi:hypothetical protein
LMGGLLSAFGAAGQGGAFNGLGGNNQNDPFGANNTGGSSTGSAGSADNTPGTGVTPGEAGSGNIGDGPSGGAEGGLVRRLSRGGLAEVVPIRSRKPKPVKKSQGLGRFAA